MRADLAIARRGLARSRTEAQALIASGQVYVGGVAVGKASLPVGDGERLEIIGARARFVSRGGQKLEAALAAFGINTVGERALDVGASTGGFTDCLLQRGAAKVVAIDVGHGQLAPALAADPRVESREGVHARDLAPQDFDGPFTLIVADLSFISLTQVLRALSPLLTPGGDLVCLVKPQFEVGIGRLGKGGVVREGALREEAVSRVAEAAVRSGLTERGRMESPVTGESGNQEYLLWLTRTAGTLPCAAE